MAAAKQKLRSSSVTVEIESSNYKRNERLEPTRFVPGLKNLFVIDPLLKPYARQIRDRYRTFLDKKNQIESIEGSLDDFSRSYQSFGIKINADNSVTCREWAPGVYQLFLTGDFNDWERFTHPYTRCRYGKWELTIPAKPDGTCPIQHLSRVKILAENRNGKLFERISPWATYVKAPLKYQGTIYRQLIWNPPNSYVFKHPSPPKPASLKIYECHIGIGTQEERVGTYKEFASNVIPRIAKLGYNAIQMMAIMEHAYYASFGYQVTSFFAVSSRFGTPDDLKYLIDTAHANGLVVLLDVVHSHASINEEDGLNNFDTTDACYFHSGLRGLHSGWGSRLFDYNQWEVLRFLLSNLRWFVDEYRFDGFRFDAVTSMIYLSHNLLDNLTGGPYANYFGSNLDLDASVYLMLANELLHSLNPNMITIAEEVSGMPGLCRPIIEGGFGFDYRLGMAIPDLLISLLKSTRDEDWPIGKIVHTLTNRRRMEKTIAYAESHDQALVGDKTLAFWLMDKEMYTHMSIFSPDSIIVDRGIALHKMMRLLCHGLGGEGYLNFMGNEFGHPEWLDFPRKGNSESYRYARRQWNLVDHDLLKYRTLNEFDRVMNHAEDKYRWLTAETTHVSAQEEDSKVIAFNRGNLVFVFNFHPNVSLPDCRVGAPLPGEYVMVLDTDEKRFGGFERHDHSTVFVTKDVPFGGCPQSLLVYAPCRTAFVLAPNKVNRPVARTL